MNNQLSKVIRTLSTVLVLILFMIYFLLNTEQFKPVLDVSIYLLALAAAGYIGGVLANGLFIKFILEPFNKFIAVKEAFYVSVISSIGNYFAPAGTGFLIRAVYLRKKHGLAYSEFISTLSGNYVLVFLVSSFVGLISLLTLRQYYGIQWLALFILFGLLFIATLLIVLFRPKLREAGGRIYRVINGWNKIASNRGLILKLLGLTCINLLLTVAIYWAIVQSIGLSISSPALLLFSVLGTFSVFVNITPANLGIKEAIYIFSASILGFTAGEMILIALLDRGVQFAVLFGLWLFASRLKAKDKLLTS